MTDEIERLRERHMRAEDAGQRQAMRADAAEAALAKAETDLIATQALALRYEAALTKAKDPATHVLVPREPDGETTFGMQFILGNILRRSVDAESAKAVYRAVLVAASKETDKA